MMMVMVIVIVVMSRRGWRSAEPLTERDGDAMQCSRCGHQSDGALTLDNVLNVD